MPRLWLGNYDFERELARPGESPASHIVRLVAEMAPLWMAVAAPGDVIATPAPLVWSGLRPEVAERKDQLIWTADVAETLAANPDVVLTPWGWSPAVAGHQSVVAPSHAAVRRANAREWSATLEREWGVGLDGARPLEHVTDLDLAVRDLPLDAAWVMKAQWSHASRERLLGRGLPTEPAQRWLAQRLRLDGMAWFEPWVERLEECGVQWEIPRAGPPQWVGLAPMRNTPAGAYAGSDVLPIGHVPARWAEAVSIGESAAWRLQAIGYFGPVGIDAMRYRDRHGVERMRPLQDVNARWTMGRLSLGLRDWFAGNLPLVWGHGRQVPLGAIRLSPANVGGRDCRYHTWVEFPNRNAWPAF